MEISLLIIVFAMFLFTWNANPFWCFDSSQLYRSLCPSSKHVHLTSASSIIYSADIWLVHELVLLLFHLQNLFI